jgi:glycosyltransferase involved in cell wall biosynthesis
MSDDAAGLPLVTIIVPVYNGAAHLCESLDSLLAQSYPRIEILVMDDASTDETPAVAASYGDRVRYYRQPTNRGIYGNANDGIAQARGEFIAVYHADDIYEPNIVEREVAFLQSHPEAGAVFCLDVFVDAEGREYGRLQVPAEVRGGRPLDWPVVFNALLTYKNAFLVCPSCMVRAAVHRDVGVYRDELFKNTSDLDMWLRIARKYPIGLLEEYLFRYRHSHSQSSQRYHRLRTDPERFFVIMDRYLQNGAREVSTPQAVTAYEAHRAEDGLMRTVNHYIRGNRAEARTVLREVRPSRLLGSDKIEWGRLLILYLLLQVLVRLPRLSVVADLFDRRWNGKDKFKRRAGRAPRRGDADVRPRGGILSIIVTVGMIQVLAMAVMLVRTKSLAVLLGTDGVGVMAVIDKLMAVLAQTVSLSLPYAAIRFLPELWTSAPAIFVARLRSMLRFLGVMTLAAIVFGVGVTLVSPELWGEKLLDFRLVTLAAFLTLPVIVLFPFLQNVIAARLQPYGAMVFFMLHAVVFTLSGVLGAWWGGLGGLYLVYAVLGLLLILPALWIVTRVPGQAAVSSPFLGEKEKEGEAAEKSFLGLPSSIWQFGLTLLPLAFLYPFAAWYTHNQVLCVHGKDCAGWMQAAIGISVSVRLVLGKAQEVFYTPRINLAGSPRERMRWTDGYQSTFGFVCLATVVPLLLFPDLVVRILYSGKFAPGAAYVSLFVLGEVLLLFAGNYQGLIISLDHVGFHVAQNLLAQGVMLAVAAATVGPFGIAGAGVASLSVPCILYLGSRLFLWWKFGLSPSRRVVALTLFVLSALGCAGLVGTFQTDDSLIVVAAKVALYGACLAGLFLFLNREERDRLWGVGRGLWVRLSPPAKATSVEGS